MPSGRIVKRLAGTAEHSNNLGKMHASQ